MKRRSPRKKIAFSCGDYPLCLTCLLAGIKGNGDEEAIAAAKDLKHDRTTFLCFLFKDIAQFVGIGHLSEIGGTDDVAALQTGLIGRAAGIYLDNKQPLGISGKIKGPRIFPGQRPEFRPRAMPLSALLSSC